MCSYIRFLIVSLAAQFCLAYANRTLAEETLPDDVVLLRDVRYRDGPNRQWALDLAMPKAASARPRAAIAVIHGGGWIEGDKSSFSRVADRPPGNVIDFARLGFVAITINYRLSIEAPFPAALHDCKCAVRWLRANAEKYNVDREAIGVWGNSAGGHLALLLGMVTKEDGLEGDGPYSNESSSVQAVVSDRPARAPKRRNCRIYERYVLAGETQEQV
ncbi:MAG: alpha/beta hydrolase fold domain-containing protein, partial [Pirellulales bacterium]